MVEATEVEQRLDAVRAGEVLDLSGETRRSIRPWVIRDLLRGVLADRPDLRGVRLRGAVIEGVLDLTDVRASLPLVLLSCQHSDPVVLVRARLPHLDLSESEIKEVDANSFRCDHDVYLRRLR